MKSFLSLILVAFMSMVLFSSNTEAEPSAPPGYDVVQADFQTSEMITSTSDYIIETNYLHSPFMQMNQENHFTCLEVGALCSADNRSLIVGSYTPLNGFKTLKPPLKFIT